MEHLNIPSINQEDQPDLDVNISETEMLTAPKSMKNGSFPGLDSIPIELIIKCSWFK